MLGNQQEAALGLSQIAAVNAAGFSTQFKEVRIER